MKTNSIVASIKDLVVIFDDELGFKEHINCKVNKANALAGMLSRSFTHLDKDMFKRLFVAIVRPHLEYGAPIWNPHSKEQITLIDNVQRRATKQTCTKSFRYTIQRKAKSQESTNTAVQEVSRRYD